MKFIEKVIKNEKKFQRMIGVSPKQFNLLVKLMAPVWNAAEENRLNRADRKRNIGGGHPYALKTIQKKIFIVLFYYKQYPTQELLGTLIGVDQSVISRLLKKMLSLLEQAADSELKTYLEQAKKDISKIF